jgi:hypothetical protein
MKRGVLCIIHNKMDHSKILLQIERLQTKIKMVVRIDQLLITLTRMIGHEHGDETLFNIPMNFSQMTLISPLNFLKIV